MTVDTEKCTRCGKEKQASDNGSQSSDCCSCGSPDVVAEPPTSVQVIRPISHLLVFFASLIVLLILFFFMEIKHPHTAIRHPDHPNPGEKLAPNVIAPIDSQSTETP